MFRKLFFLILGIFMVTVPVLARAGEGPALVTIAGNVEQANRGASDKFTDAFLAYHEIEFTKALDLDLAALKAMQQVEITADVEGWSNAVTLRGPTLEEVLTAAWAMDKAIVVKALDGYQVEFSAADIKARQWVLAIQANGKSLSIGGRGPLWLAYDTDGKKVSTDEEAKWVWSVFFIDVR